MDEDRAHVMGYDEDHTPPPWVAREQLRLELLRAIMRERDPLPAVRVKGSWQEPSVWWKA